MNADELLPLYFEEVRPGPSVSDAVLTGWSKFADFVAHLAICDIRAQHLEEFQKKLLWEPFRDGQFYAPNSVDQFLRRVRQVLRWAHQKGYVKEDPTRCLLLPRPLQPTPTLLTWAELQRLSSLPDLSTPVGLRDALLLALLIETDLGLRAIVALPVEAKPPLEDLSKTLLETYLEQARPRWAAPQTRTLLVTVHGKPMTWGAAKARLSQLSGQAGLGVILERTLRRSYLAYLEKQRQMRHSSFS